MATQPAASAADGRSRTTAAGSSRSSRARKAPASARLAAVDHSCHGVRNSRSAVDSRRGRPAARSNGTHTVRARLATLAPSNSS